jgi:ATP-binding cassette, subfamily F, member 3
MLFRLAEISKSYAGNEILRDVSFQVNVNEKIGLVGRNGAGKTTVFRLITDEESPDNGTISKMNNLRLGLLAQNVQFVDDETVHTSALSAFQKIHDIEAEMRRLEKQMETDATEEVLERYSDLQHEFEIEDGFTYTARAEAILLGLGFTTESWNQQTKKLSGGQKNRLGMARLLLSAPDVLLLDEPTNHLDVEAVEWLENFLKSYEKSYVIISHDRYFLDQVSTRIIEIDRGRAVTYKGNYSSFLVERAERREQQKREFENQQTLIAKNEEFIRRNIEGQKTKMAKSRRTMLERLDRVEAVQADKSSGNFNLKNVVRSGDNVLKVEDLAIGYGESVLSKDITFTLLRGECIGIIGGNGTGKTTFLTTILGKHRELGGEIIWGSKTDLGYYSQKLEDLDHRNDIIGELRTIAPLATNGELRGFLAKFLFTEDDVFKKVGSLSGGEQGRLALAKLIYSKVNVLILDEPTNHLDIPSREALEEALQNYPGTIITVSHDRYFLDQVATQILEIKKEGKFEVVNGNYSEYQKQKRKKFENRELKPAVAEPVKKVEIQEPKAELSKNQRQRIQARISEIEVLIPKLEEELSRMNAKITTSEFTGDNKKLTEMSAKIHDTEQHLQKLYDEWDISLKVI